MRAALALAAFALAGCGLEAGALAGRVEVLESDTVTLPAERRVLALDGFAGTVTVAEHDTARAAHVRWARRAGGATHASAAARLARVSVRTGGDAEIAQVVWRADGPPEYTDDLLVDVRAVVPPGMPVVVRLGAGALRAEGLTGVLDAEVAGEAVVRPAPAGSVALGGATE